MGIFETLMRIDDQVVDWILHATPKTDDDRDLMRRILDLRGDLEDALNRLVAYRLRLSTAALPDEAARLSAISQGMTTTEKQVETAEKVLSIVGEVVAIAAKVVAFVAA